MKTPWFAPMAFRQACATTLPPWLPPVLALLFLNGTLSFSAWWPTPGIVPDRRLAPEFLWLWVILLGLGRWRGGPSPRLLALLSGAYLLLVLGRYLDVAAPALFGREINLYWDAPQVPRFLWVTAQELPWWVGPAAAAALLWRFPPLDLAPIAWGTILLLQSLPYLAALACTFVALRKPATG